MRKSLRLFSVMGLFVLSILILVACGGSVNEEVTTGETVGNSKENSSEVAVVETVSSTEAKSEANLSASLVYNTIGGLPGNIANTSFWGFQDDYMYYTANYDLGILNLKTGDLSKIKNGAGNSYQILGEYAFQSNLMGLNKVNLTTGEIKNLSPDFAGSINAVDSWIYYINGKDSNTIYRIDTEGQNREKLSDLVDVDILLYYDGQLYFNRYWNNWEIYKMNLDGSDVVMLQKEWIEFFLIHDNDIYFSDESYTVKGIFRFDLNGGNKVKLTDAYGDHMNVCGGYLFFNNALDEYKLYRINLDGFEMEKVLDFTISYIHSYGDYLYLYNTQDPEMRVHRMHYDSNTLEPMNMPASIE